VGAVFLSYGSQDAAAARRICEALRAAGIEVWFDQSELRGGDAWDQQIRRQIRECALFVAVISAHTDARNEGYFRREWKLAVDRTDDMAGDVPFLLPVVIDDTSDATARVPDRFRQVQWTSLPGGATTAAFVARVARLLTPGRRPSATPPAPGAAVPETAAAPREPARAVRASRWSRPVALLAAAAALIAAGYLAIGRFLPPTRVAGNAPTPAATGQSGAPSRNAVPEKSIAVLPFVDMSEQHDQEYLSDGLSEELIDLLTKVPELRVPARTSAFYFKGRQTTVAEIAKTLSVAHVLEGSVRKAGRTVRITVQLIRVDNGYHVWSQSYERDLKDVFRLQDEIAGSVVQALKATLLSGPRDPATPAIGAEGYNLYLQARFAERHGTAAGMQQAIALYEQVVALEPKYAIAWARLADAYQRQIEYFGAPAARAYAQAREAASRALAIDPLLPEAHVAMGGIYRGYDWDWASAEAEFRRALALDPHNQAALLAYGNFTKMMGRRAAAIAILKQAVDGDPLRARNHAHYGWALWLEGRLADAEFEYRKTLELAPEAFIFHVFLGRILLERSKRAEALAEIEREPSEDARRDGLIIAYYALGRKQESDRLFAEQTMQSGNNPSNPVNIAALHAERDEVDQAFAWLQRGYEQRDPAITGLLEWPSFRRISADPRFKTLLRKMQLPE
jgi:TolB-like protein/lipoprotein NlpI